MQQVRFLVDTPVSLDGLKVRLCKVGEKEFLPDDMVQSLISDARIELVLRDKAMKPALKRKAKK